MLQPFSSEAFAVAVLACAGACSLSPRDAGVDVTSADAQGATDADALLSADVATDAPPAVSFRRCTQATRDPEGGFCDVTARWDVHVVRSAGSTPRDGWIVGALCAADFDGDGHVDIVATDNQYGSPTLLLRLGERFVDATTSWGLADVRRTSACAAFDVEGDGDTDLAIASSIGDTIQLFRNEGTRFAEAPALGGTNVRTENTVLYVTDLDRDGRLDIVAGYLARSPRCTTPFGTGCPGGLATFRQADAWRFEPVASEATPRRAQALRMFDWDDDGIDELLVAADFGMLDGGNQVLRAIVDPAGTPLALRDATAGTGFDQQFFGMGIAAIDADGDGRDEVLVTNFGRDVLLRRDASGSTDVAAALGAQLYGFSIPGAAPRYRSFDPMHVWEGPMGTFQRTWLREGAPEFPTTKWVPVVFDFDDDGIEDVFIPSGQVGLDLLFPEPRDQPATLLRGTGTSSGFTDVTGSLGLAQRADARNAVAADFDGDGDVDIAVLHSARLSGTSALRMLRNDASRGHSLTITAHGRGAASDGIGARVEVRVGGRTLHRRIDGNLSIGGTGPHEIHVGLGAATAVDEVVVRFPSGAVVRRSNVPAGRTTIDE